MRALMGGGRRDTCPRKDRLRGRAARAWATELQDLRIHLKEGDPRAKASATMAEEAQICFAEEKRQFLSSSRLTHPIAPIPDERNVGSTLNFTIPGGGGLHEVLMMTRLVSSFD